MAETNGITEIDGRRTALTIAKAVAAALVVELSRRSTAGVSGIRQVP